MAINVKTQQELIDTGWEFITAVVPPTRHFIKAKSYLDNLESSDWSEREHQGSWWSADRFFQTVPSYIKEFEEGYSDISTVSTAFEQDNTPIEIAALKDVIFYRVGARRDLDPDDAWRAGVLANYVSEPVPTVERDGVIGVMSSNEDEGFIPLPDQRMRTTAGRQACLQVSVFFDPYTQRFNLIDASQLVAPSRGSFVPFNYLLGEVEFDVVSFFDDNPPHHLTHTYNKYTEPDGWMTAIVNDNAPIFTTAGSASDEERLTFECTGTKRVGSDVTKTYTALVTPVTLPSGGIGIKLGNKTFEFDSNVLHYTRDGLAAVAFSLTFYNLDKENLFSTGLSQVNSVLPATDATTPVALPDATANALLYATSPQSFPYNGNLALNMTAFLAAEDYDGKTADEIRTAFINSKRPITVNGLTYTPVGGGGSLTRDGAGVNNYLAVKLYVSTDQIPSKTDGVTSYAARYDKFGIASGSTEFINLGTAGGQSVFGLQTRLTMIGVYYRVSQYTLEEEYINQCWAMPALMLTADAMAAYDNTAG